METRSRSALGAARVRANEALSAFGRLPGALRLGCAAVPVLIVGVLMPWADYGDGPGIEASLGVESVPGGVVLGIAVLAVLALAPLVRASSPADSGAVAGLGLLASGVVGAEFVQTVVQDLVGPAYGIYVAGAAAAALFAAGVLLFGGAGSSASGRPAQGGEPLPPPD